MATPTDVTRLLAELNAGQPDAREKLFAVVYEELRGLAKSYLRRERPDHTLQPTALVNEAWMRLADQKRVEWKGRAHFFGIAAQAMRRILVDHHRRLSAGRRRGQPVTLIDGPAESDGDPLDLIELDRALTEFGERDARAAKVVELRYFGGLSVEETAAALEMSTPTVKRDWRAARAWLYHRLGTGSETG